VVGLRRLRAFTMPDVHCFCKDLKQAMDEYAELFRYYTKLANSMEIDYVVAFRVVEDFYNKNKKWFVELLKVVQKPALIELLPEMKHYWIVKHEYQMLDAVGGNAQLCTVQLDVEDSERYGIFYTDEKGKKKGCIIIHSSMGSIERWIYAILEQAAKMKKQGKPPMLPVWLSPIQVRVIPISAAQLDYAKKVADEIEERNIRVDVDDREITLAKKIRDAEMEWTPFISIVGEKEQKENSVTVRIRGGGQRKMEITELTAELDKSIGGKPRLPLHLPRLLSAMPKFSA
jgi:threonyl-tRNA synthetase